MAILVICYPLIEELFDFIFGKNAPKLNVEMHFNELGRRFRLSEFDLRPSEFDLMFNLRLCEFVLIPVIALLSSITWYIIVALLFINIPVAYFLQCFKENQRYKAYKKFWWITLFLFAILTTVLFGSHSMGEIYPSPDRFISTLFGVLYLTLIPGAYLYSKQSLSDNNSACLFSTTEYMLSFVIIIFSLFIACIP